MARWVWIEASNTWYPSITEGPAIVVRANLFSRDRDMKVPQTVAGLDEPQRTLRESDPNPVGRESIRE